MKTIIQKLGMFIAMLCASVSASAYDFKVDGLYYDIVDLPSLTVKVVGCNEEINEELTIPSTVKFSNRELTVIEIADDSFKGNVQITSLRIGDNVNTIGTRSFAGCDNIKQVFWGASVADIKDASFEGCSSIQSISFNNRLESIGNASFYGCSSLNSIDIPNSVKKIGARSFYNCDALTKVNIKDLGCWCMIDRSYSAFDSQLNLYMNDTPLTVLNIPNTVSEIKPYTFSNFSNIKDVHFPTTIKKIGKYAFEGCGINSLSLPESLDSIQEGAFSKILIEELTIPKNVIYIEELQGIPNLKKIEFEDGEIPIKLSFIAGTDHSYFVDNTKIEELYIGRSIDMSCGNGHWLNGQFIMDSYYSCLVRSAFWGLKTLKKVVIGKNCNQITPQWFYKCKNLENLIILDGVNPIEFHQNIYYDKYRENCYPPYDTQYKYVETFADCPLSSIYIGRDILYTQKYNGVSYPNKRLSPFQNKGTIENVVIGDFVTNLPADDFFAYDNIKHFEIGRSLTNIPNRCLAGNDAIVSIVLKSETPPVYSTNFSNSVYISTSLYVPESCIDKYQTADPWKYFWNISAIENMGTGIHPVECNSANEINIVADGVVYVGNVDTQLLIYSIDGKLHYSSIVRPQQFIKLSQGFYIVRIKDMQIKIRI